MEKIKEMLNKDLEEIKSKQTMMNNTINEEEIGNLLEKEFRVIIVKMIQNLGNRMEAWMRKYKKYLTKI